MICTAARYVLLHDLYCCAICTTACFVLLHALYCCAVCTTTWFVLLLDLYYCVICTAARFVILRVLYYRMLCTAAQFVLLRDLYCCVIFTAALFVVLRDLYCCFICTTARFVLLHGLYWCAGDKPEGEISGAFSTSGGGETWMFLRGQPSESRLTTKNISKYLVNVINLIIHVRMEGVGPTSSGSGGGLLWVRWRTVGVYKMWEIYWLAETLLTAEDGLFCVELVC